MSGGPNRAAALERPGIVREPPEVSVVVPFHNEGENAGRLLAEVAAALDPLQRAYEVVCVDDGSTDGTHDVLAGARSRDARIRVVRLRRNFGQTAALAAGFDHARGRVVISLDGDLQHDPAEIPGFLAKIDEGFDVVSGWRQTRPESLLLRRIPSRIANSAMAWLSGVAIHDFGTTFKAYRRDLLQSLDLYGDFHRFIPALARDAGARITEVPINVRPRARGASHYGILRTVTVFFDLIRIRFLSAYLARPLQLFGSAGLLLAGAGAAIALYLIYVKLAYGLGLLTYRWPLFVMSGFGILLGIQLFCLGLLGEIIVRLYFGLKVKRPYTVESAD